MNPRRIIIAAVFAAGAFVCSALATEAACGKRAVRSEVEIVEGELSLADLLEPGACPTLLLAARQVRLGAAPLPGSKRVFEGGQVRAFLQKLEVQKREGREPFGSPLASSSEFWTVPERISVRRAGRASCADLAARILATLPSSVPAGAQPATTPLWTFDCAAAGRIPENAAIELSPAAWNPGLAAWEIASRCGHPADCVPFLVRVRENRRSPAASESGRRPISISAGSSAARLSAASPLADERPLVRRGQTATLLWDQDGIRLLVPVRCLEPGALGRPVRARILPGGRVIVALVEGAGRLRVAS